MTKLCRACNGPVCTICGGCINEGECACEHAPRPMIELLVTACDVLIELITASAASLEAEPNDHLGELVQRALAIIDRIKSWQPGSNQQPHTPPLNLRPVEFKECVTCASGDLNGPAFICNRPGGPRWTHGEETEHTCDLWARMPGM